MKTNGPTQRRGVEQGSRGKEKGSREFEKKKKKEKRLVRTTRRDGANRMGKVQLTGGWLIRSLPVPGRTDELAAAEVALG